MTLAILSDLHAHRWSTFSTINPDGVNSRLRYILDELVRAAEELVKLGGRTLVISGDLFHVRGAIDPEVLNPFQATALQILEMGVDIVAIPGNHDLATKETTTLGSSIQTLSQTFSMVGVFRIINEPQLLYLNGHKMAFVPWCSSNADLLVKIEALSKTCKPADYDLFIHAGIDGVIPGNPEHGLTAAKLAVFGWKHVWAGHYHNRMNLGDGIWSIGASTHQTWSDLDSKAGFVLLDDNGDIREYETRAPKFIDVSGLDEVEMALAADGNYVRFRGPTLTTAEVADFRKFFMDAGAKGVSIQTPKALTSQRSIAGAAPGTAVTLDQSVLNFIEVSKDIPAHLDRNEIKKRSAEVLTSVRAIEEA